MFLATCFIHFSAHVWCAQVEFEAIFREYGEEVQFQYLNGLERVLVSYKTEEQASKAIELLQSADFQGTNIRVCPVRVSGNFFLYINALEVEMMRG